MRNLMLFMKAPIQISLLVYCQLICCLVLLLSCTNHNQPTSQLETQNPPNIVLILIDDLGKEWISSYGADNIQTENIDRLAGEGIRFENVYCMPQCTPSRVTLLTGQYPFRHGWVNHWDVPRWGGGAHFDETLNPSIGKRLKEAGYKTCIAGKWQIDDFRVEPDALTRNGFDEYCMWTGYETGIEASAERYQEPYIFTKEGSRTYAADFGPDVFTRFITNFISNNKGHPFFVYYPMVLTHTPLVATPDESPNTDLGRHQAMVRYTDKIVGSIMEVLERSNLKDNTLLILTTDNGSTRGITGSIDGNEVKGAKARTSEAGVCVPFIISWPGKISGGQVSKALIDFTDIYPTLTELAGAGPIKSESQIIDGTSFYRVLAEKSEGTREWIMSMGGGNNAKLTDQGIENQFIFRDRVLRNHRYKLYVDTDRKPAAFYDLELDPYESYNLIDSLDVDDRRLDFEKLWQVAEKFPDRDMDPIYTPNPPQEWDVSITAESQTWKQ